MRLLLATSGRLHWQADRWARYRVPKLDPSRPQSETLHYRSFPSVVTAFWPPGGPWAEACLLECVAGLTSLRSLTLCWRLQHDASPAEWRGLGGDPEHVHVHTTHLLRLSTLTNLQELDLVAPHHRRFDLKWDQELQHTGPDLAHCRAVWAEQRSSLLTALRAMPRLRALHCPHMYFEGSELAALTSLGALCIGGFIPSFVADQMQLAPEESAGYAVAVAATAAAADPAAAPGRTTAPITLPPKLEILQLGHGGFLSALVAIQPPPSLRSVSLGSRGATDRIHLHFSTTTSREGYGLVPSAAADFRRVAELLSLCHVPAAHRSADRRRELSIAGRAAPDALQGPLGEVGHGRWLRELQPLGLRRLVLTNLQLEMGDLLVIAESLDTLQVGGGRGGAGPAGVAPGFHGTKNLMCRRAALLCLRKCVCVMLLVMHRSRRHLLGIWHQQHNLYHVPCVARLCQRLAARPNRHGFLCDACSMKYWAAFCMLKRSTCSVTSFACATVRHAPRWVAPVPHAAHRTCIQHLPRCHTAVGLTTPWP